MTDVEALALGLAAYAGVILIIALIAHSRRCPLCPEGVCRPYPGANATASHSHTRTTSRAALRRLRRMLLRGKADPGGTCPPHESPRHEWGKP